MFERFTSSARRAMVLANKVARDRNHTVIAGAHIALGLLDSDAESAGGLSGALGVAADDIRAALEAEADSQSDGGTGKVRRGGNPPFTPGAKKALEMSLREALRAGHNWIGPGHMMLGILNAAASTTLVERLPLNETRDRLTAWEADQPFSEQAAGEETERNETIARGFTEVMKAAMSKGTKPVGSHHLLLAMFEAENTLARKVLDTLGVTEEKVTEAISALGTAGTIDAPPPAQVEIRAKGRTVMVDEEALRSLIGEAAAKQGELAERLRGLLDDPDEQESDS